MRKYVIIHLILIISLKLYSQTNKIDLFKYDFFGFKMNQTIEEIEKYLKSQKKDYVIEKETDFLDPNIEYIIVKPKGQDIREGINLDYQIVFYKSTILSIMKFNILDTLKNKLINKIYDYFIVDDIKTGNKYYHTKDFIILFQQPLNSFTIYSKNNLTKIWDVSLINTEYQVLKVVDKDAYLFTSVDLTSKKLRILENNEKLKLFKKNKSDKINNKEFTWYEVFTKYFEYGYIPSNYVTEIDKKTIQNLMYKPSIDNLRFRESPTLDGKFIRMLIKGEKLEFIEKGKEETINGAKGTWVKVKTEKGEIGWCFDAYLEEVK